MTGLRVGTLDLIVAGRPAADTFTRANYLSAAAIGVDSFWVPDHLNSIFPRALWQPKYCGAARIQPSVDASMEPWTMLGNIAARNRIGRLPLGIGVTDAGRRNPAVTAQAAATVNLLNRGRFILGIGPGEREGNEPYGVDWSKPVGRFEEAMATIRALWDPTSSTPGTVRSIRSASGSAEARTCCRRRSTKRPCCRTSRASHRSSCGP